MSTLQASDVVILSGTTTSDEIDLTQKEILAILIDGSFTGTAITFTATARKDDTPPTAHTFRAVKDGAGAAVSVTVASNTYVCLTQAQNFATQGLRRAKLVSGSSEGADRVVTLIVRDML